MHALFTDALLLHLTPYRDADAVVQVLSRNLGLLSLLARGARKSRKRFGGALDYFCLVRAEVRPGRQGMGTLLGVELLRPFQTIAADVDRYWAGCRLLEAARLGAREGDPAPALFDLLISSLGALDAGADPGSLTRVFQTRLLGVLGYGLPLDECCLCGEGLTPAGAASLSGAVSCRPCAGPAAVPLSPGALQTLRAAGRLPLDRLGSLRVTSGAEAELGGLLDAALASALGRRPRSLDVHRHLG